MAFVSGKYVICAAPDCDSTSLSDVRESWDEQDQIFVGEQKCDVCGAGMLYSRRPETPQEIAMLKKKKPSVRAGKKARRAPTNVTGASRTARVTLTGPKGEKLFEGTDAEFKQAAKRAHRVNTVRGNGALPTSREVTPETVPVGEAMRRAVEELGAVKIDNDLAPHQMLELAECYEDVTRRRSAFSQKADEAKTAKKSLESATELLLEKVRSFTHPKALPLFDAAEREQDQDDMLDSQRRIDAAADDPAHGEA